MQNINQGDKYDTPNWQGCSPVEVLQIYEYKGITLVHHGRTLPTGFIHEWHTRLDVFLKDIADGELVPHRTMLAPTSSKE